MIQAELISSTIISDSFHTCVEQLTGNNPAQILQQGNKPKSKMAYSLAYFKAFYEPESDTSNIKRLAGMSHFGMLCAGNEFDLAEVTGCPHGLYCLQNKPDRNGLVGVIFTGTGQQWHDAICYAGCIVESNIIHDWGMVCYQQFAKHNLTDIIGTLKKTTPSRYYLP